MKKVGYLAGAAGMAPVIGLMVPPGNAVATVTHAPEGKGKTVSLAHFRMVARPGNTGDCPGGRSIAQTNPSNLLAIMHGTPGGSCISRVSALLSGGHTNLDMRTRFYKETGAKVGDDHFDIGHPYFFSTSWRHTDTVFAWSVCIAIVKASPMHTRKYGDICLNTSQLKG